MSRFTLRARWVLPVAAPPIEGGCVAIDGDRIADVGSARDAKGPVEDLGDAVLLPGLVNAHTHLEFSDLERPLGDADMPLPAWIRLVIGLRSRSGREAAASIAAGIEESLRAGVTTIGEIATERPAVYATASPRPTLLPFQEAIGFSAQRVASVTADVAQRFAAFSPPAGISPHAPYTAHPQLVENLVDLAVRNEAPVAMHLAESREELELLATGGGPFRDLLEERSMWDASAIPIGARPLNYLRQLARAPRALVIHGNYLDDEEIAFLAKHRATMSLVYCPRTHAYFGHDAYSLRRLIASGVRVALGTDSRASSPDLSMLDELRFAAAGASGATPDRILQMATLDAAAALGFSDRGALTVGWRADVIAVPADGQARDPYAAFLGRSMQPIRVWLAGIAV